METIKINYVREEADMQIVLFQKFALTLVTTFYHISAKHKKVNMVHIKLIIRLEINQKGNVAN